MGKALIIAEKPSVASDIAKALGGFKQDKSKEFYESENYLVSSAVGHLLELTVPEEFDVKRGKWTFAALPHLPPRFGLQPIERSAARLKVLQKLLKRKDVDLVINACDAGREGELIFRNIIEYSGAKQPVKRLWLQSMTAGSIREGFQKLRTGEEMQPLADASRSRSEADWLVGINGTRAMTAFNSKAGGFYKTTVGRVQTPTLAIVVEREAKVRKFVPRDYWEVLGTFGAQAGSYPGRWFDEHFKKTDKDGDIELKPERLWDRARAEAIRDKCLGKPGIVTEESKPATQISPLLYDLTTLQREANGRFGFSAKNTLAIAQSLYERHKVLTYPRTDARALPEDYIPTVKKTLDGFRDLAGYSSFAEKILTNDWVKPNKRIFNNAKISDHFAIIPTGVLPKGLSEPEQKLFDMVTKRFLAIFYPAAEFLETVRITRVESEPFKSVGKVLVKAGWLEVYGKEALGDDEQPSLAPVQANEEVKTTNVEVKDTKTKPPPRFTEATLLGAMESAGKLIDDDELRDAMSERGLGTPATRAAIIEGLIAEAYIHRNGRELVATAKAFTLMQLLDGLGVNELTKPEMTGDWEFQLRKMQRGQLPREQFMGEIRRFTEEIVAKAKQYDKDTIPGDFGALSTPCPKCGSVIHEKFREWKCASCDFYVRKVLGGRMFEPEEVEELITKKQIGPLQGFRSKQGFPFAAVVKLTAENEVKFDFGNEEADGEAVVVDFTGKEPIGKCPKCGANVYENGMNYVCEKAVGAGRTCDFKTGAVILQQPIEKEQVAKLLRDGKTDLLKGFVSKKTNRKFEAFLVYKEGKVSFEFAPRERKFPAKDRPPEEKIDFTGKEPLAKCPKCGGKIFEGPTSYICENGQRETKRCTFKLEKVKNGQPIDLAQLQKLVETGKTDLLTQFVSKAGKPFSAHLVLEGKGKIGFEFGEREETVTE
ncbi:MAG TPA: DNA topoisomerase III [Candidatus Acidoferrum sp.]|nr:DNA topoisomerase III [Candidatus Acidoferrum sp.]